jgi:hypothetical protein
MERRQWIPGVGLLATVGMAAFMVAQLYAQAPAGDFANAATAEVRNAQGQIVLRGQFVVVDEEDDDVERKATLEPTGIDPDATGEAEVEIPRNAPANQEIEFSIRNVDSGMVYTFVIDGQDVATATANQRGRAEVELNLGASSSRQ